MLIGDYGWRAAYLGLGLIALIAFPVALFLLVEPSARRAGIPVEGDTLRVAATRRAFWFVLAAFFLLGVVGSTIVVHQVRILLEGGVPPGVANLVPVALGVALIVARIGTGWLLDRFPVSRIMAGFLVGRIVALLLLASGPTALTGLLAAALGGLLIGAEFDVLSYLVPRYFGRLAFGKIYGITAWAGDRVRRPGGRRPLRRPGPVRGFAVERSTLSLLFFQGGYGRFSPGSFVAAPDPELIQAAQLAEAVRARVEDLAAEFSVNCSVLARIRWDAVQVLAANGSPVAEPFPLGHR